MYCTLITLLQTYSTTTRQEQLAKLTPSQVIELGYLSALLEQHCGKTGSLLSHKFEVIKQFLEDVVKVVPFESIAYAIASGNYQTAMQCSMALKAHNLKIPETWLMDCGLTEAVYRLKYGIPMHLLSSMQVKASEKFQMVSISKGIPDQTVYMDSGKLVYELNTYLPGTQLPLHQPIKVQVDEKNLNMTVNEQIADELKQFQRTKLQNFKTKVTYLFDVEDIPLVSTTNIEDLYPIHDHGSSSLNSPISILGTGRKQLTELSMKSSQSYSNQLMLNTVNTILQNNLDTCTSLLGGFMHQRLVDIVLSSNRPSQKSASVFYVSAAASVGVWALFSLNYSQVQPILAQCQGEQLLVKLFDHVKDISGISHEPDESEFNPYAAKLQFIAQGMTKTVTCNTQHVSYSLERQLVDLCKEQSITTATSISTIMGKWSVLFKEKTLSLVHYKCRLLIARWLKWALMIHNLREELAKYTAVGVVGLVNSGKSKLISTLFGIEVGT